jgi:biotin-dependent carboxylase-like uncharacterized protein
VIEIVNAGIGSSFQDLGRLRCAHLGVGRSGAADRAAHALANRLLGNQASAAAIETYGALSWRAHAHVSVVVTGAPARIDVRDGPPMAVNAVAHVPPGAEVTVRPPDQGMRCYVAVRGGLDVAPVLGSRSLDTLAGIGPRLERGAMIRVGPDPGTPMDVDVAVRPVPPTVLSVFEGPRRDWFTDDAWAALLTSAYVVSGSSDRVGVRLAGPALERRHHLQLPSEGMVEGAVEVPPDGQPIVMLSDHPVTGGYPVIAVVSGADLAGVAQARPGSMLRFRHTGG